MTASVREIQLSIVKCFLSAGRAFINALGRNRPWKYQPLADAMIEIQAEDECNGTCGRVRLYQALILKQPENVEVPSERTIYRVMEEIGLSHPPKRKPKGITKSDREARKWTIF